MSSLVSQAEDLLTTEERAWLNRHHKVIEVLFLRDAQPNMYIDELGKFSGHASQYNRDLENALGVTFGQRSFKSWSDLVTYSKRARNFIILGVSKTESRAKYLSISETPFIKMPFVLVTRNNSPRVNVYELENRVTCSVKNLAINEHLSNSQPNLKIKKVPTTLKGLHRLMTGSCDVMISHENTAIYHIEEQKIYNLKIAAYTDYEARLSVAVSNKDSVLFGILNKTVSHISNKRSLDFTSRWLRFYNIINTQVTRWFLAIVGALFLIISLMWIWTKSLKREAEKQLSSTFSVEEEFQNYVRCSPYGIFVCNFEGRFIRVNPAFERLTGYASEELLKMNFLTIIVPEQHQKLHLDPSKLRVKGSLTSEATIIHKHGDRRQLSLSSVKLDESQVLGFTEDISRKKALEAEKQRLVMVIEQGADAVAITNRHGFVEYLNPAFSRLTGYSQAEILGMASTHLFTEQNKIDFKHIWRDTLSQGTPWQGQVVNRHKNGTSYTTSTSITPIEGPEGQVASYVYVIRDISKELAMEQTRIDLETRYHHAQKIDSIGRLAGGIAHDLNNLLIPILCYGELLENETCSPTDRIHFSSEVFKAGIKARDLVSQLLAYSKNQSLEIQPTKLIEVVKNMRTIIDTSMKDDIEVEIVLANQDCLVLADANRMEQVIMNLVLNAVAAMPLGGYLRIVIESRHLARSQSINHARVASGDYVILTVEDDGVGMTEQVRQRMFEPFFSTRGTASAGLGLATVYGIVKQHQGFIVVKTSPNKGTKIEVMLPALKRSTLEKTEKTGSLCD